MDHDAPPLVTSWVISTIVVLIKERKAVSSTFKAVVFVLGAHLDKLVRILKKVLMLFDGRIPPPFPPAGEPGLDTVVDAEIGA